MFLASKLLIFLTQPLAWVAALMLLALALLGRAGEAAKRWGLRALGLALFVLLAQGWEPLPDALLRTLEDPYAHTPSVQEVQAYDGVVVLGGALEPSYVWEGRSQVALNDSAERMLAPLVLLRQKPDLQLLFAGGEGDLLVQGLSEAARAQLLYGSLGLPLERLLVEDRSRTTYENAALGARVPGVDPSKRWLLVTSAWHMRRALATFEKVGWNVTPYAVDFTTGSHTPWSAYSLVRGSRKWELLLHEWLGLLAYRLAGQA
ncbi:MAG: YdcF family protein [Betaproteobacteria bacterium]